MSPDELSHKAHALLSRFYGYKSFRPLQFDIISHVMSGRDCVVLMPTGGGKSICYQIPAMLSEGVAIIVSPLIALMQDQVMGLIANGIPAAAVNSNQSEADNRTILDQVVAGHIKLLYISPERLLNDINAWPRLCKISLIAIDEAHCISQWGHDFRPEYTKLSILKEQFPNVPIAALTATADKLTREDICTQLRLKSPKLFISSFDRPNISIKVMANPGRAKRLSLISTLIKRYEKDSGIIYCLSRKIAEDLHNTLRLRGFKSGCYHAGMSARERNATQQQFINGELQVVCATIAFGMGIDKSNIRWVLHNNMPRNIESYYQEIGRAGRDGMPAEAIMFHSFSDIVTLQSFINESGQQLINTEKLNRMKEFTESTICRRRMLLSYFNEQVDHDCGNCDVCLDPPERIDGTTITLMALSALARVNQQVGITMLIDILRGSAKADVIANGYDKIKTYGVGHDLTFAQWNNYLLQMLQLGIIDIAYNEGNHLKITPYGRRILSERQPVTLSKFYYDTKERAKKKTIHTNPTEELLSTLKELRAKIAKQEGMPPYLVFSDKTLMEMATQQPVNMETFAAIEGISEKKVVKYWQKFVSAIRRFKGITERLPKGASRDETLLLFNSGMTIEEIATTKKITTNTVYAHFVDLINTDKLTDFSRLITREQYHRVLDLYKTNPKEMYLILSREMPVGLPNVALAIADALLRHKNEN